MLAGAGREVRPAVCTPLGLEVSETQHLGSHQNALNNSSSERLMSHTFQIKESKIKRQLSSQGTSLLTWLVNIGLPKGPLPSFNSYEHD